MALFKPFRGSRSSLDALEKHDGYAYFCIDDGSFHIDYVDENGNLQRKQINENDINQLSNITSGLGDRVADLESSADDNNAESKAIIDVTELPTEDINKEAFYRLITANFINRHGIYSDFTCICVETLPETGEPVTTDMVHALAYYDMSSNECYGYIDEFASAGIGVPVGWYDAATIMGALSIPYGGVILDFNDVSIEEDILYLLIDSKIYSYAQETWMSHNAIGQAGTMKYSEIFNNPTNIAFNFYAHAEGNGTIASGEASHAEGQGTKALGIDSHAEGYGTEAYGDASHAEGNSTRASGDTSHAEGYNTVASKQYSHAEGENTVASGESSHAEGYSTSASGDWSHAEGASTVASGSYSHAEGCNASASGSYSHAEGASTEASDFYSHAEGYATKASGPESHAEGHNTTASEYSSHAEGSGTTASGKRSHAEGYNTRAYEDASHAEGYDTEASGINSHAEGNATVASGRDSHAEGYQTEASGPFSHAEGDKTTASGHDSHAEGENTLASGDASHAEGYDTVASGTFSHAEGNGTIAASEASHVEGKYNIKDTSKLYAHIVGNGTGADVRSNAHTLDWGGTAWFAGEVRIGGTGQDDENAKTLATEDFVNEKVSEISVKDGKDGISATHSWDGTTLTITSASGTSSTDLKGEKGEKPVKGVDYWTEADKAEIIAEFNNLINRAEEASF